MSVGALALLQALGLWFLHDAVASDHWPAQDLGLLIGSYLVILAVPLLLVTLWSYRAERLLWTVAAGLALFLAFSSNLRFDSLDVPASESLDEDLVAQSLAAYVMLFFLGLPILRARIESGVWLAPYTTFFQATWRSALTLAEAVLFLGIFWALLLLWAQLFSLLGIDLFRDLFADARFVYPASTLAFATATRIVAASERLLDSVLEQLLDVLKWLAPLAGLIAVLFTLVLVPRLPGLLSRGERILDSSVLIALVSANVLLLNAGYRDGTRDPGYGRWLREAFRVVPPALVIVSATAFTSLMIRVQALGLTPSRLWGLVAALFAVGVSVGYVWAALGRRPWSGSMQRVNFVSAVVLLLTLIMSLTPTGNPLRWSILDQQRRAVSASTPELRDDALYFLRFDAGEPGRDALADLQADPQVGPAATRMAAMVRDDRVQDRVPQATEARYQRWRASLQATEIPPPTLERALRTEFMRAATTLDPGGEAPLPRLLKVDLDVDGSDDFVLIAGSLRGGVTRERDYRVFIRDDEEGTWQLGSSGTIRGFDELDGAASTQGPVSVRAVAPRWKDLELDGQRLTLLPATP